MLPCQISWMRFCRALLVCSRIIQLSQMMIPGLRHLAHCELHFPYFCSKYYVHNFGTYILVISHFINSSISYSFEAQSDVSDCELVGLGGEDTVVLDSQMEVTAVPETQMELSVILETQMDVPVNNESIVSDHIMYHTYLFSNIPYSLLLCDSWELHLYCVFVLEFSRPFLLTENWYNL